MYTLTVREREMMHFIQEYNMPCCSTYLILMSVNVLLPGMICISEASDVTAFAGGKCPVPLSLTSLLAILSHNKARERAHYSIINLL